MAAALALTFALGLAFNVHAEIGTHTEQAGDLVIYRTAPKDARVGQTIWVVIEIENTAAVEKSFRFVERLSDADFDHSQAKSLRIYDPGPGAPPPAEAIEGPEIWYYEWEVKLSPGQRTSLAYWLVLKTPGTYVISPAQIFMDGQVFQTSSWDIFVHCTADGVCQTKAGENFLTCPDDCATGAVDGICDGALDGKVDPDCDEGYDSDMPGSGGLAPSPTPEKGLPITIPCIGGSVALIIIPITLATLATRSRRRRAHRRI